MVCEALGKLLFWKIALWHW